MLRSEILHERGASHLGHMICKAIAWAGLLVAALAPMPAAEAESRFAMLDGNRIHYVSYGRGDEAVVFIHGWTCDHTFWRGQAPIYEERRSLLIDLPGHGESAKPDVAYTMELFARAVDAVMTDAGVTKAILVGHSMGAPVALQLLRMQPGKVKGLVLVDGFLPLPPKDEADRARQKAQAAATTKALRSADYKATAGRIIATMFTPQTDPALQADIRAKMLATPQNVMASAMEWMWAMPPMTTERYLDLGVDAVMRKRGNSAGYEMFLKQHFNLVGYQEFAGAGHFLMLEQPARFNEILREFLQRK